MNDAKGVAEADSFSVLLVEDNPGDVRLVEELLHELPNAPSRLLSSTTAHEKASADAPGHETDPARPIRSSMAEIDAPTGSSDYTGAKIHFDHCETCRGACERLRDASVDVVLLDLNLPDSSGIDTLEALLDADETVPVVVLTGIPEDRLGKVAVARGAQDYLPKERVTSEVLVRTIEYAVERKQTERQLRERTAQLAVLNRLMRHDIRNDLSLIVGRANELADHVEPRGRAALSEIVTAGNHVLQLTRSIDDSSETVVSGEQIPLASVDLGQVIQDEVSKARALYDAAEITLACDPPSVAVRANRLLSSVFGNLISNALLYNDSDTPTVTVDADFDADTVTVTVADNGRGIPVERQDDLFDRGTTGEDGGTGTGLYLVSRLVERFGGEVWAESLDSGTAFNVELSLA